MTLLALGFLAPLLWMVTASLKPKHLALSIPPTFLPRHFQWQNYVEAWDSIRGFLFNSVKLAVLSVGGTLFVSSLAAFAFARIRCAGRDIAFAALLSTIMVPSFVTLIPLYYHLPTDRLDRHPRAALGAARVALRLWHLPAAPVLHADPAGVRGCRPH